jgi:hypothetical protein
MPLSARGQLILTGPRGRAEADFSTPGVAVIRYVGLAMGEFTGPLQARLDAWLKEGRRVTLFVDAVALEAYETPFRKLWAGWMRDHRDALDGVHILFRSKIVEMGISIVNPLIGGLIRPWSDSAAFANAIADARRSVAR